MFHVIQNYGRMSLSETPPPGHRLYTTESPSDDMVKSEKMLKKLKK